MRKLLCLLILLSLFVYLPVFAQTYDHTINAKEISFSWKIDKDTIHIKLSGKTDGWVGIGFNPEKKMKGANFILGMIKRGKVKITDHFGNGIRSHRSDKKLGGKSHIKNKRGSEVSGVTEVMFSIPLNSGDRYDKLINPSGNTIVFLALGAGRDSFNSRHKAKYIYKLDLTTGKYSKMKHFH